MPRKFDKSKKSPRGAPHKRNEEKKASDGLTNEQQKQVRELAALQGISIAQVKRDAVTWYLEAIEQGRIVYKANIALTAEDVRREEAGEIN